ncbi:hypothetical protein PILCRDRAFT_827808 [Piloderma croceum F 1598]|uniref:Uncharacterized protein n=1 Tax=Piloderma croceum (strain F 1598) TaxID=765440 RepID=A0A0C3F4R0_PILCF|nr:hypothetical protein PILCRDRAFT_827808 [Piloderma croceum F 1598]
MGWDTNKKINSLTTLALTLLPEIARRIFAQQYRTPLCSYFLIRAHLQVSSTLPFKPVALSNCRNSFLKIPFAIRAQE